MSLLVPVHEAPRAGYQPEVDGLRAVAVMAVLFFHAGFTVFGGGFTGVDVFFVISGYLITRILIDNCQAGSFSFARFMARRIARLYPALLLTLVLCLALGFLVFSPGDYIALAESTIYAFFSISNIKFWLGAGYFDTSSETNPLLHTWSLGVEQQFYLVWPFIVYGTCRLNARWLPWVLALTGLLSLLASQWYTQVDPSANYFLTPFRVFEFAIGGLLVFAVRRFVLANIWQELIMLAGLALLAWGGFVFDKTTAFPGFNGLVPAFGAALCIFASGARYTGWLLRNRWVVFIGLISYSVYLIHWPLIVFYKYYIYRPLMPVEQWALVIVPLFLGYAMYVLVENRFRRMNLSSWYFKEILQRAGVVAVVLLPAFFILTQNGMPFRMNTQFSQHTFDSPRFHEEQYGGAGYGMGSQTLGDPRALFHEAVFLGDSYARQFAYGLDRVLAGQGVKIDTSFEDGCFFGPGYTRILDGIARQDCQDRLDYALHTAFTNRIPLIYAISFRNYQNTLGTTDGERVRLTDDAYLRFLQANFDAIHERIGLDNKLIIIGTPPGAGSQAGLSSCVDRPAYLPLTCARYLTLPREKGNAWHINQMLAEYARSRFNVIFIDPYDILCGEQLCQTMQAGRFLYSDGTHLSRDGSLLVSQEMVTALLREWGFAPDTE